MSNYNKNSKQTYYQSTEFGLNGRRFGTDIKKRLDGFKFLLDNVKGKSVLDIGCAEGLISLEFAKAGASLIHGFDLQDISIKHANLIFSDSEINTEYKFKQFDFNYPNKLKEIPHLLDSYDIVLFLGIYHHLKLPQAKSILDKTFQLSKEYVVVRTDAILPNSKLSDNFKLVKKVPGNNKIPTGKLNIFKRV